MRKLSFLPGPTSRLPRDGSLPAPAPSPAPTASRCSGRRARGGRSSSTRLCSPTSSLSSSGPGSGSGSSAGRPPSQIKSSLPEALVTIERNSGCVKRNAQACVWQDYFEFCFCMKVLNIFKFDRFTSIEDHTGMYLIFLLLLPCSKSSLFFNLTDKMLLIGKISASY